LSRGAKFPNPLILTFSPLPSVSFKISKVQARKVYLHVQRGWRRREPELWKRTHLLQRLWLRESQRGHKELQYLSQRLQGAALHRWGVQGVLSAKRTGQSGPLFSRRQPLLAISPSKHAGARIGALCDLGAIPCGRDSLCATYVPVDAHFSFRNARSAVVTSLLRYRR
jgi:hypothetical protein